MVGARLFKFKIGQVLVSPGFAGSNPGPEFYFTVADTKHEGYYLVSKNNRKPILISRKFVEEVYELATEAEAILYGC